MSGSPDKDLARADEPDDGAEQEPGSAPTRSTPDMALLVARGDAEGLLDLARAHRAGTGGTRRDLPKCLACYREAAKLGSAEAEYSVALFYLSGGVVAQDLKEGAARLRAAADGGYLPAKVYLANLYELGVHFAEDAAKADVWYRSAARAAQITADPDSPAYERAMAELGCARYCLTLAENGAEPEAERERFLKKAKAYGYQLALRRDSRASAPPSEAATPAGSPARTVADAPETDSSGHETAKSPDASLAQRPTSTPRSAAATSGMTGAALAAFFYATLFVAGSIAAGYFFTRGAEELLHRGMNLPLIAEHPRAVFPLAVALFGVLPPLLMYKAMSVARASLVGALLGGAGYALWGASHFSLLPDQELQGLLLGAAGFLGALLVLGLFGGLKPKRKPPPRILA